MVGGEYNFDGNNSEGADAQTGNKTRLASSRVLNTLTLVLSITAVTTVCVYDALGYN